MLFRRKILILSITLFTIGLFPLSADVIALHPFKGQPNNLVSGFFDILAKKLPETPGNHTADLINLARVPPDVPEGGFPAYICPSPSITKGAPYSITGEVFPDPDFSGKYRLRLYLWEMKESILIGSDEMTAQDMESCEERMPSFLTWLLSWIDWRKEQQNGPTEVIVTQIVTETILVPGETVTIQVPGETITIEKELDESRWLYLGKKDGREGNYQTNPGRWIYLGPGPDKWIHLGFKGGAGTLQWFNNIDTSFSSGNWIQLPTTRFWSWNAGIHASVDLWAFFALQVEANLNADFGNIEERYTKELIGKFTSYSMNVPVLLKFLIRGSQTRVGIFAGPYLYIPLFQTGPQISVDSFEYKPSPPIGIVGGLSAGWMVGQGFIFIDGRFEYDRRWNDSKSSGVHYRNGIRLNLGYEIGVLPKNN